MTVGAAAQAAGVSAKAVRLWEAKGLLPPAERTGAGYRLFTGADRQRPGAGPCERVTGLLDAHIADMDRTLADLRQLRRTLTGARRTAHDNHCQGTDAAICQIIETAPRTD